MSEYSIDSSVIESEGRLIIGSVVAHYYELIDTDFSYEGITEKGSHSGDVFIAYDYAENYDGYVVPVLYKTDMEAAADDEEFEQPDYEDQFFYVGTAEIDGVTYDKWRKIEDIDDEFCWESTAQQYVYTNIIVHEGEDEQLLINKSTLTAIANKIRKFVKTLNNSANGYIIDPSIIKSEGIFNSNSIEVVYKEYIDYGDGQYDGLNDGSSHSDVFIGYGFLQNDENILVPVIYDTDVESYAGKPDYSEPFFYMGTEEIDGVIYDKWRKIEVNEDTDSNIFTWDSDAQQYIYTNIIIQEDSSHSSGEQEETFQSSKMYPSEMPDKITQVYNVGHDEGYSEGYDIGLDDGNISINTTNIIENGVYDVADCYEATVAVPSVSTVDTIDDLPPSQPNNSIAIVKDSRDENINVNYLYNVEPKIWNGLVSLYGNYIWHDNDGNTYYSAYDKHYVLKGDKWVKKTWSGETNFYGNNIWTDGTNIYHSNGTSSDQYILNGDTWEPKTWSGKTSFDGKNVWKDNNGNIYLSCGAYQYILNGDTWETTILNGLNAPLGEYIWYDNNDNIYYSYPYSGGSQYILNGDRWVKKTWNVGSDLDANNVWKDNNGNIYYSSGTNQYILNGDTWEPKTWNGLTSFDGEYIWTDNNGNIYYSSGTNQYILNGDTWEPKTWNGLTSFSGTYVWNDNDGNIYYSNSNNQHILNGDTWEPKTWNGLTSFSGTYVWKDNNGNVYYSSGTNQYTLNGDIWETKIWNGLTSFSGEYIWNDNNGNIYYSDYNKHYIFVSLNGLLYSRINDEWVAIGKIGDRYNEGYNDGYDEGIIDGNISVNTTTIIKNGVYDVADCYEATVSVPSSSMVQTFDELSMNEPDNSIALVLNTGEPINDERLVKWRGLTKFYSELSSNILPTKWSGLTEFNGVNIWSDGSNIYYSNDTKQYVLNGDTWEPKVWKGRPKFQGRNIWSHGGNTYLAIGYGDDYVLNGDIWEPKTWNGVGTNEFYGEDVWSDGTNIYYSYGYTQYVLNGDTWEQKTWGGTIRVYGRYIWSDGKNIYYSNVNNQYVLNNDTWEYKNWEGLKSFEGWNVWSDGTDIYYSSGSTQYVLNDITWESKTWNGITGFDGRDMWSDGTKFYCSTGLNQGMLLPSESKLCHRSGDVWTEVCYVDGYDIGYETAKSQELYRVWDDYQAVCENSGYVYAFAGFAVTDRWYKPTRPIIVSGAQQYTSMFSHATQLTSTKVPIIIDSTNQWPSNIFAYCYALRTIPSIKVTDNVYSYSGWFLSCEALEEINFTEDSVIKASISFQYSSKLNESSIQSIINALKDLTGSTAQTLTLHATVGSGLTEEQKAAITAKNWTLVY
jgi:hypothetical protein